MDAWKRVNPSIDAFCGDYFSVKTEAVVSPGNSFGFMDGNLDYAISEKLGWDIQRRLQEQIRDQFNGELLVGQAVAVSVENNPDWLAVVCAPTMRVPMAIDPINIYLATRAAVRCAIGWGFESLTLPGMGMGCGKVAPEIGVMMMRNGIHDALHPKPFPASWKEAQVRHFNGERQCD